jgi:hypothetical protein
MPYGYGGGMGCYGGGPQPSSGMQLGAYNPQQPSSGMQLGAYNPPQPYSGPPGTLTFGGGTIKKLGAMPGPRPEYWSSGNTTGVYNPPQPSSGMQLGAYNPPQPYSGPPVATTFGSGQQGTIDARQRNPYNMLQRVY